jgi:hypothetical protein
MDRMNILNYYYSSSGNTKKVGLKIDETVRKLGHNIDTIQITNKDVDIDILKYDFVFAGSGVYGQLPGQPLIDFHRKLGHKYHEEGEVSYSSPRRPSAYAVVYCTYGGGHTGINEAIPSIKYMGQLFDHLGYTIVGEWDIIGEYTAEESLDGSIKGRFGDIRGRPSEADLREIAEKVKGILKACSS